jgi:hypothetical protein
MMKQPAGNTNATAEEASEAAHRVEPLPPVPEHDEIAEVARELWRSRGAGGSPESDWFEAEKIVKQRRAAIGLLSDSGNDFGRHESHSAESGNHGAENNPIRKENSMNPNYNTGTMEQTGSNLMNQAREQGNRLREQAEQYIDNEPKRGGRPEHREGPVARSLEQQTARIPSDAWLWAAFGSIGLSLAFELSGREKTANFIGHWAPTFLIIGLYNKVVKLQGSDGV